MRVHLLLLPSMLLLGACDLMDDAQQMQQRSELIAQSLKSELNLDAQIGWHEQNGVLVHVSVVVDENQVGGQTLRQLIQNTYPIVRRHFDSTPLNYRVVAGFRPGEADLPTPGTDVSVPAIPSS